MLVLSRFKDQSVDLYEKDETAGTATKVGSVVVLQVKGDRVKLGFQFGNQIHILRTEVALALHQEVEQDQGDNKQPG